MNTKMRRLSVVSVLWLVASQANAEMKMIEDEDLAVVTGQKGLTIDMAFGIEIGEFMYQDAGSIAVQGFRMGGMDNTGATLDGNGIPVGGEVGTKYAGSEQVDTQDPIGALGIPGNPSNVSGGSNLMNNIRIKVDVAGDGSDLANNGYFRNPVFGQPAIPIADNIFFWAWGDLLVGGTGSLTCGNYAADGCGMQLNDGDLFIHASPIDASATQNNTAATIADFGIEIDSFKIKGSSYNAGDDITYSEDSTAQSTTIFSNLKMEGYLGGFDMLLENKGNGFGTYDGEFGSKGNYTETGVGFAASKIKINSFFKVTEMEYDFNIAGLRIEGMSIHNNRGSGAMFDFLTQDSYAVSPFIATTQGYAQSNTQIFAVNEYVVSAGDLVTGGSGFVDGVAMYNRFSGDIDIAHMSFGDTGTSIGGQYWTDIDMYSNMIISAH